MIKFLELNIQLFGAFAEKENKNLTSKSGPNKGRVYAKFTETNPTSDDIAKNQTRIVPYAEYSQGGSYSGYSTPKLVLTWYDNNENKNGKVLGTTNATALSSGAKVKVDPGEITVKHLNDGTLKGYLVADWIWTGSGYCCNSGSATTANTALTNIPRANTFKSVPDSANVGQGLTVTLDQKNTAFSTTLTITCNGKSETVTTTTNTATFALSGSTFAGAFGSSESKKTATITAKTYNGSTQIGDAVTDTVVLYLPSSTYKPSISISAVDTNFTTKTLTGDSTGKTCVLNASTIACTINATPQNNATISSLAINGANVATNTTSYTISNSKTNKFTASVKDSRGFVNEATATLNVVNYFKPTITALFKRNTPTDGKVTLKYSGTIFNKSFGAKANTFTFYYEYKLKSASSYTRVTLTPTISGDTFSGNLTLSETYDYKQNYSFRLCVVDAINTVVYVQDITKGTPVYWWNENGVNVNGTLIQKDKPVAIVKKSKNLFNKDYIVSGYRLASDGTNYAESGYFASNFIPIEPNTYYYINNKDSGAYSRVAFYNVNREFISANIDNNVAMQSPSNARYLRFSNYLTRLDSIQLEVGQKGTSYESYIEPKIYLNRGQGDEIFPLNIAERLNNADANMLVDKFTVAYGSNLTHTPVNYGQIISIPVMDNKNYVRQFFISNYYQDKLYTRCRDNGAWTNWRSFAFSEEKNAMTIYLSATSNYTISTAWSYTKLPLNSLKTSIGSKLTFTSNSIKIGAGVSYVKVSANAMMKGIANDDLIQLCQNSTIVSQGYYRCTNTSYHGVISLSPVLIKVNEGDLIHLKYGSGGTGTLTITGGTYTYLTVEVVE